MSEDDDRPSAFERLDDRVERLADERARKWYELGRSPNLIVRQAYRMIVLVVGLSIVGIGLVLIVLPGPWTIPLVLLGLAILASEFVWARLLLQRAKVCATKAKEKAMGKSGLGGLKKKITRKP
jgi:hypothetical protein